MLQALTDYLVLNKYVTIPSVGAFSIKYQPAVLDFPNRLIHPLNYLVEYQGQASVSHEQLAYLSRIENRRESELSNDLENFGKDLKRAIERQPFNWKGIGTIEYRNGNIFFISRIQPPLQPVLANKVIHENASHSIRRGEQEFSSHDVQNNLENDNKRSVAKIILWVIVAVLILLVLLHFFQNGFDISSTGSNTRLFSGSTN